MQKQYFYYTVLFCRVKTTNIIHITALALLIYLNLFVTYSLHWTVTETNYVQGVGVARFIERPIYDLICWFFPQSIACWNRHELTAYSMVC